MADTASAATIPASSTMRSWKMIETPGRDLRLPRRKEENCFPMIPSGAAHTEMLLQPSDVTGTMDDEAKALV
jgi:acetolactate synthase-1/2/3 large subunit